MRIRQATETIGHSLRSRSPELMNPLEATSGTLEVKTLRPRRVEAHSQAADPKFNMELSAAASKASAEIFRRQGKNSR